MTEDFKIKGKRISSEEKAYLSGLGLKWCWCCKMAKCSEVFGRNTICKPCAKERYLKRAHKMSIWGKAWRSKNKDKIREKKREYAPKRRLLYKTKSREWKDKRNARRRASYKKNPQKTLESNKRWQKNNQDKVRNFPSYHKKKEQNKIRRKTDKAFIVSTALRNCVSRIKGGKATRKTLDIISVESVELFIELMAGKCGDDEWVLKNYHIDHIWQVNWFDLKLKDATVLCSIINHHSNLRPIFEKDNLKRSVYDFTPLLEEDFPKYQPYLKPEVAKMIADHFSSKKKCNAF